MLDGMALDEVIEAIQELAVLHHVRHNVLPLVVQVTGNTGANEALKNKTKVKSGLKSSKLVSRKQ